MATDQVDKSYLREFFGIPATEEGDAEIEEIRSKLVRIQFSDGQDICTVDTEPDGMFFLTSGTAVVLNRDGEQLNVMREGQYFGEYAVLAQERRLSTVRSLGRTVVYRLGPDDMMEILHRHPGTYGELMKRVYDQVSRKHSQLLTLSRMRRGILQDPGNQAPMSPLRMLVQYGILAAVFVLTAVLVPKVFAIPLFIPPLILMTVYVLITHRTVESLIISGMLAAVLLYRSGLAAGYTDALMVTMGNEGNVFTVLVMALMGGVVTLIEASGAVTAFKKLLDRRIRSARGAKLAMLGIMAITAIDDCLNMLCASTSAHNVCDEQRVPREESALMLSLLPTNLSAFLPFSLWGIFVLANINTVPGVDGIGLLLRGLLFNFFPILTVLAMLALCFGKLPRTRQLKAADKRVADGGKLWPEGSERYLVRDDTEVWGKIANLLLPVAFLAVASIAVRSLHAHSFLFDSACGLVATLIFMFFLYCAQGILSPEQFVEHLVSGIQNMALPILLYLITMCFSALLEQESIGSFLGMTVDAAGAWVRLLPAAMFLIFTLLTMALGSSWAMYAIAFPLALRVAAALGLNMPLVAGAICAAGIAGEKNCVFTSDSLSVGLAAGCDPKAVLAARMPYSLVLTGITLVLYAVAGFLV